MHDHLTTVVRDTRSIGAQNHRDAVSLERDSLERPQVVVVQARSPHAHVHPLTWGGRLRELPDSEAGQRVNGVDGSGVDGEHGSSLIASW